MQYIFSKLIFFKSLQCLIKASNSIPNQAETSLNIMLKTSLHAQSGAAFTIHQDNVPTKICLHILTIKKRNNNVVPWAYSAVDILQQNLSFPEADPKLVLVNIFHSFCSYILFILILWISEMKRQVHAHSDGGGGELQRKPLRWQHDSCVISE